MCLRNSSRWKEDSFVRKILQTSFCLLANEVCRKMCLESCRPFRFLNRCYFGIHNIFAITLFSSNSRCKKATPHDRMKKRTRCSLLTTNHKLLKSRTVTERWEWNMVRDKSWKQVTSEPRIFTFRESDSSKPKNAINFQIPFHFLDDDFPIWIYVKASMGFKRVIESHFSLRYEEFLSF